MHSAMTNHSDGDPSISLIFNKVSDDAFLSFASLAQNVASAFASPGVNFFATIFGHRLYNLLQLAQATGERAQRHDLPKGT